LTGTLQQADKLVLDTLACANERRRPRQRGTTLRTQLLTIMRELHVNESTHRRRKQGSTVVNVDEDAVELSNTPTAITEHVPTELTETMGYFSRLPVEQREVLALVAVEGMPYDEIATLLGVSIATVMARLSSARESMRSMVSESLSRGMAAK
jgi:RNA polymerase sigma-70 factor (ECF subfamily)